MLKLNGWDEELKRWQDWDMHIRALLSANKNYLKTEDKHENIDSFYRKSSIHSDTISNFESSHSSTNEKITAVIKYVDTKPFLNNPSSRMEIARLVFFLAKALSETNRIEAKHFLETYLKKLGYSKMYYRIWKIFLFHRYDLTYPRLLRKFLDIIPMAFQDKALDKTVLKINNTHLEAKY